MRVKDRVNLLIDETTGRMLRIPKDCLILEGVGVLGRSAAPGRWFCPREIYPFWREAWLRRVEDPAGSARNRSVNGVGESRSVDPHDLVGPEAP